MSVHTVEWSVKRAGKHDTHQFTIELGPLVIECEACELAEVDRRFVGFPRTLNLALHWAIPSLQVTNRPTHAIRAAHELRDCHTVLGPKQLRPGRTYVACTSGV